MHASLTKFPMMKHIRKLIVFTFLLSFDVVRASHSQYTDQNMRKTQQIFTGSSNFDWTVQSLQPQLFTTSEVFDVESFVSTFIKELMMNSPSLSAQTILTVDMDIRDQTLNGTSHVLQSVISLVYEGTIIVDFASYLAMLLQEDTLALLLDDLKQNGVILEPSTTMTVSFVNNGDEVVLPSYGDSDNQEQYLLIGAVSFASVLFVSSIALLRCVGAIHCNCTRREQKDRKLSFPTSSTNISGFTLSPGILGAKSEDKYCDIDMATPQRNDYYMGDPNTPAVSTNSCHPLGIIPINALTKQTNSPNEISI